MSYAKTLRTLARNLGDAAVAAYAIPDDAPQPVPSLVIPPTGFVPTIDCPNLLIVAMVAGTPVMQGPPAQCALVLRANLTVTVTRCVANLTDAGQPAAAATLTADALSLMDDASVLFYGITGACRAGTLWAGFSELGCADTTFGELRPGASGGIAWFTWTINVNVGAAFLGDGGEGQPLLDEFGVPLLVV